MSDGELTPPHAAQECLVDVADLRVASRRGLLVTTGLGSCVAVALYDRAARVAGLAHVLLPDSSLGREGPRPARFADHAVPTLLREMRREGARGPFQAKLVGGARMFGALLANGINMGERNLTAVRRALARERIPVLAEDVGGEHGRSVAVDVATFAVHVTSLQRGDRVL